MKTLNPYSASFPAPSKQGYQFWGINISNIPTSTTETQISNEFKKYGDIFSIKSLSNSSMNIIFKSPRKPSSIEDITNQQKKFKVTPLGSAQLPIKHKDLKKPPVAKLSLLKNNIKFSGKSTLSSSAAPFTSPPRIIHITNTTKVRSEADNGEGVFFEAICKSISHGTTEEHVLDFIAKNIYHDIKNQVVKDGMMMLPGESMAVFELTNTDAIKTLSGIIAKMNGTLQFNGHTFTLQRKSDGAETAAPNTGLTLKMDDVDECDRERTINSNGVNVVNDKNGVDYLIGVGFDYGLKDDAKKSQSTQKKNFYFKLPEAAPSMIAKQAQCLDVPKQSFLLMLGVYTTDGPIPVKHYLRWKQDGYIGGVNPKKKAVDSMAVSNKNSAKSGNVGEISLGNNRSVNSQCSTVGSTGSTPAVTALFGSNGSKRLSPNDNLNKAKKFAVSGSTGSLLKAPLVDKGSFNRDKGMTSPHNHHHNHHNHHHNNHVAAPTTQKRMFQYPQATALGASSLFQNSSHSNLLVNNGVNNNLTLISPRGVSLIRMKHGANSLLSPTAAALLSPRQNQSLNLTGGPPPVVVPNTTDFNPMHAQNVGNGFQMTTPIANITPVHIPNFLGQNGGQNGGHSPIHSGFQSPINYNINTPQSPLGNYSGITPIINAFTPTANGVSAITPTTNLPFYWSNIHNGVNNNKLAQNQHNTMGHINMDNDPLAPSNMSFFSNQSNNPYVQKQLQNSSLLRQPQLSTQQVATSPICKPPASTFFKYPIPSEEPKSSPSNSNNVMNGAMLLNNGVSNNLIQNQSLASYTSDNMNDNMNVNNNGDDDNEEPQMDEPPSLDEINNMRSIPSVISPNGTTPVVMITNLNEDQIDCDKIFTLCGVFGDVQRVKISYHKRDTAFVQLANHRQAKHVVTSLNRMQLYGKMIHVNLSRMTRVKLPKDSPNSAMMFPDAKFLTKDYTNCKKHRYSKKGAGGIKYSPLSIGQPSHILHIANLPIQSEAKDLQEFLCGNGIFAKNVANRSSGLSNSNDKIQSIELIGVNNKLGSCQAFAKCHSVDIACQILIDYHSKEFLGREIKISFATRSHMPSDINKTHKTYSYSTAKKIGASINSIPTSIPRQNSNPPQNNSGDNMSSSGSSNGHSAQNGHNGFNGGYSNRNYMENGHHSVHASRNSYNNNNRYNNSHSNQVSCTFPKNVINQRNSYMSYDNSVGYQTYNIVNNNKQPPPDQDKIFVRQHHHSGGRKYHYKLRINK